MDNIHAVTAPNSSIFSKFYSILRLLWYFPGFLIRNPSSKGLERVERVIRTLRHDKVSKVALQGYCWGGKIAVHLAQKPDVVDAICSAHPGGLSLPADIDRIQKPVVFVLAEKDWEIKAPQVKIIEDTLAGKPFEHRVQLFPHVAHGFAVRGDENDPAVKQLRQDAFNLAANFFKKALEL